MSLIQKILIFDIALTDSVYRNRSNNYLDCTTILYKLKGRLCSYEAIFEFIGPEEKLLTLTNIPM